MRLRLDADIQLPGITLMRLYAFRNTIGHIVINGFMESLSKFADALSLKINQSIDAFDLAVEACIFLGETHLYEIYFIHYFIHN